LIVSTVFPTLLYAKYKVLGLPLRALIHSELLLVQGDRHKYPLFPVPFVEEAVFSPLYVFITFVKIR
jgi:hypothetical protein